MNIGVLRDKVAKAGVDCGTLNARLGTLMSNPDLYAAEIDATKTAIALACTWSSTGAAVLGTREMSAATTAATKARKKATPKAKPAPAPHASPEETTTAVAPKKTPWGWIVGAGTLALGALTIIGLRKQPTVVRMVRQATPKRLLKGLRR